jgi:DNA-binding response OmpR family regulator
MATSRNTILCVDDEHNGLVIRRLLLEKVGYTVLTAETARDAIDVFTNNHVDAVVLDYLLPDVDGGRLATAMRLIKPEIPIILLSAHLYVPDEVLAVTDAYVAKGQSPTALLDQIKHVLRNKAQQTA